MPERLAKIEKLNLRYKTLERQRNTYQKKARQWAKKRTMTHNQIKDLRLEATNAKERRDAINANVKVLKIQRDQTRSLIQERMEKIRQLKINLRHLLNRKPRENADIIRKSKEQIEWQIQTTSLTLPEEKPLVEKANQLEGQLVIYSQISNTKRKIVQSEKQIKTMNEEASFFHNRILELAQQSQKLHEKMIEILEKANALQIAADSYHENFVKNKHEAQKIQEKIVEIRRELKTMTEKLELEKKKEEMEKRVETRRKLKVEATKKLKQGKKLTFEEFKLLSEEGQSV